MIKTFFSSRIPTFIFYRPFKMGTTKSIISVYLESNRQIDILLREINAIIQNLFTRWGIKWTGSLSKSFQKHRLVLELLKLFLDMDTIYFIGHKGNGIFPYDIILVKLKISENESFILTEKHFRGKIRFLNYK